MPWGSPRGARCMPTRPGPKTEMAASAHFEHEAGAVFDGAAVLVGALVGAVLEELIEEVAVGAVEFDAVETGGLGVLRRRGGRLR